MSDRLFCYSKLCNISKLVVQIPHVWVLNAYESRDHMEEVKRPTSKDINFLIFFMFS